MRVRLKSGSGDRRAGEMLAGMAVKGERARGRKKESRDVTLSGLGISRMQSHRWQRVAGIPDSGLEAVPSWALRSSKVTLVLSEKMLQAPSS